MQYEIVFIGGGRQWKLKTLFSFVIALSLHYLLIR